MLLKKLLRAVRKWNVSARRARGRRQRFGKGLEELRELKWQYDTWLERWLNDHDHGARSRASKKLRRIYRIIGRLARNNHKRQLRAAIKELRIPGAAPYLNPARRSRRR